MNAITHTHDFTLQWYQVEEVMSCMIHSVLNHRAHEKLNYSDVGASLSMETLEFEDVQCDFIDLTYVRWKSYALAKKVDEAVKAFKKSMTREPTYGYEIENSYNKFKSGEMKLVFYKKKKSQWSFFTECQPWEIWTFRIEVQPPLRNEIEKQINRDIVGGVVSDKVIEIAQGMINPQYEPSTPSKSDFDNVFDRSFPVIQPYLFELSHSVTSLNNPAAEISSVGTTVRRILEAASWFFICT